MTKQANQATVTPRFRIGQFVRIKLGVTLWMMAHGFFDEPLSIDDHIGEVTEDFSSQPGDRSHYAVALPHLGTVYGVHPQWLEAGA